MQNFCHLIPKERIEVLSSKKLHLKPNNQLQKSVYAEHINEENLKHDETSVESTKKVDLAVILETEQNYDGAEVDQGKIGAREVTESSEPPKQNRYLKALKQRIKRRSKCNIFCCNPIIVVNHNHKEHHEHGEHPGCNRQYPPPPYYTPTPYHSPPFHYPPPQYYPPPAGKNSGRPPAKDGAPPPYSPTGYPYYGRVPPTVPRRKTNQSRGRGKVVAEVLGGVAQAAIDHEQMEYQRSIAAGDVDSDGEPRGGGRFIKTLTHLFVPDRKNSVSKSDAPKKPWWRMSSEKAKKEQPVLKSQPSGNAKLLRSNSSSLRNSNRSPTPGSPSSAKKGRHRPKGTMNSRPASFSSSSSSEASDSDGHVGRLSPGPTFTVVKGTNLGQAMADSPRKPNGTS